MLDSFRRNVRRLSWTLWLVIAAFIVLYIPDLVGGRGNVVARVDGEAIMATEFQRAFNEQMSYYRSLNQGQLPNDFNLNFQVRNVVLEQLVRRRLLLAAARDQGFAIAPQEIKDRMMEFPVFRDEDGYWVGDEEYRNVLLRNGLDVADFERSVIEDLLVERVQGLVTEGVSVTDAELEDAFQRQNEQVGFDFVQIRQAAFELEVRDAITDADLRAHYDGNPDAYRLPERRRVSYALLDTEDIRDGLELDEETLRAEYEANISEYTLEEQLKARKILFRLPPNPSEEDRAAARTAADAALERLQAGEEFAALASELSDDPSASAGGDLGWVTRGRQVEGFDEAAFALQAGETSEVFETTFGLEIVRVEELRDEQVQPFDEVRGQLEQRLAWARAEERAADVSETIRREVLRGSGLEAIAEEHGLSIDTSPLFTQATGFGEFISLEFTNRAFGLGDGRVAEPVRVRQGYMVFRIDEIAAPHTPAFEDTINRVREDVVDVRSRQRAGEVARGYAERLAAGELLANIAEKASTVVDSSEPITRDGFVPVLGRAPMLTEAVFELNAGESGGPVEVNDRLVLFQVTEHQQPDWSLFAEQRDTLRDQETANRRNRLFEAFVQSLRESYSVRIYDDVLQAVSS